MSELCCVHAAALSTSNTHTRWLQAGFVRTATPLPLTPHVHVCMRQAHPLGQVYGSHTNSEPSRRPLISSYLKHLSMLPSLALPPPHLKHTSTDLVALGLLPSCAGTPSTPLRASCSPAQRPTSPTRGCRPPRHRPRPPKPRPSVCKTRHPPPRERPWQPSWRHTRPSRGRRGR